MYGYFNFKIYFCFGNEYELNINVDHNIYLFILNFIIENNYKNDFYVFEECKKYTSFILFYS